MCVEYNFGIDCLEEVVFWFGLVSDVIVVNV